MKYPQVSVIIPVLNGEKTLRNCLDSVLNQTYKNYEVIVVDNNSSDGTKNIIKYFQKSNNQVKYLFEKYKSRSIARNTGILNARGKILIMTDSDCIVPTDWIEKMIIPITEEGECLTIGFQYDLVNNYWSRNIQKADWEFFKRSINGKYINHIDTKNFAIKADIMKKLMFDPNLKNFEDLDLYLRLKKSTKIRFNPLCIVGHQHKSSFLETVKLNFDRGYWTTMIYKKNTRQIDTREETMMESISVKNFIAFPFWITLQLLIRPPGQAYFLLVSELSWRTGIVWAILNPPPPSPHS